MLLFEWIIHDRINTVLQTLAECVCECACVRVRVHERSRERKCVCVWVRAKEMGSHYRIIARTNFHNP